jgi:hypothetical protein
MQISPARSEPRTKSTCSDARKPQPVGAMEQMKVGTWISLLPATPGSFVEADATFF